MEISKGIYGFIANMNGRHTWENQKQKQKQVRLAHLQMEMGSTQGKSNRPLSVLLTQETPGSLPVYFF